ncbi:hypothetical protein [Priestia megaterium]|uniref:hypothetical protein n=1 Tax=Priestia megaterium TaxID=1404 RepID=UPI000B2CB9F4|nr:hypothetical protein [Priestia megaterium]MCM3543573.1 hypothetical protein [Priestia megaterium]
MYILVKTGIFEGVIITELIESLNELEYEFVVDMLDENHIYTVPYLPKYYESNGRSKL